MAALRRILKSFSSVVLQNPRVNINNGGNLLRNYKLFNHSKLFILGTTGFGVFYFAKSYGNVIIRKENLLSFSFPQVEAKDESVKPIDCPHTRREARFQQFASLEYDGNIFMTPQDFLESVTEEIPRPRIGRMKLAKSDLEAILKHTPLQSRGSDKLFRKLHDKGVISYTEYLFLLCVLTMSSSSGSWSKGKKRRNDEPHSGFRIAFNMFDTDGNQIVDKREFLVLETFFILPPNERKFVPRDPGQLDKLFALEKVFSTASKSSSSSSSSSSPSSSSQPSTTSDRKDADSSQNLRQEVADTTLLVHFFGRKGKDVLKYKDFHRFMENLQSEIIELEFMEFSKGLSTISEVEFAKVLLRYTNLDKGEIETCIGRVREKFTNEKGISFEEFHKFFQFLNNLDDFAIAMKMYTFSMQSISQEEFQRAVKVCTGYTLGPHIVNTVFQMFDADGDNHLSHKEFISIMKDRLHRGVRSHLMQNQNTWEGFKSCVKHEMRSN